MAPESTTCPPLHTTDSWSVGLCRRSRHEDRLEDKPRPMQRTPSQEGIFAPGGRGGGGFRPGGSLATRGSRQVLALQQT